MVDSGRIVEDAGHDVGDGTGTEGDARCVDICACSDALRNTVAVGSTLAEGVRDWRGCRRASDHRGSGCKVCGGDGSGGEVSGGSGRSPRRWG